MEKNSTITRINFRCDKNLFTDALEYPLSRIGVTLNEEFKSTNDGTDVHPILKFSYTIGQNGPRHILRWGNPWKNESNVSEGDNYVIKYVNSAEAFLTEVTRLVQSDTDSGSLNNTERLTTIQSGQCIKFLCFNNCVEGKVVSSCDGKFVLRLSTLFNDTNGILAPGSTREFHIDECLCLELVTHTDQAGESIMFNAERYLEILNDEEAEANRQYLAALRTNHNDTIQFMSGRMTAITGMRNTLVQLIRK